MSARKAWRRCQKWIMGCASFQQSFLLYAETTAFYESDNGVPFQRKQHKLSYAQWGYYKSIVGVFMLNLKSAVQVEKARRTSRTSFWHPRTLVNFMVFAVSGDAHKVFDHFLWWHSSREHVSCVEQNEYWHVFPCWTLRIVSDLLMKLIKHDLQADPGPAWFGVCSQSSFLDKGKQLEQRYSP